MGPAEPILTSRDTGFDPSSASLTYCPLLCPFTNWKSVNPTGCFCALFVPTCARAVSGSHPKSYMCHFQPYAWNCTRCDSLLVVLAFRPIFLKRPHPGLLAKSGPAPNPRIAGGSTVWNIWMWVKPKLFHCSVQTPSGRCSASSPPLKATLILEQWRCLPAASSRCLMFSLQLERVKSLLFAHQGVELACACILSISFIY